MFCPAFLETPEGNLFIQQFVPSPSAQIESAAVLFVPPFAEELNKSRRMIAQTGYVLSQQGYRVCVPDLLGTGDSAGDFSDATWAIWQANLKQVADHMLHQGASGLHIVGLRLGALLAADLVENSELPVASIHFWQPVLNGQQMLNQFLRVRVAAGMMNDQKETVADLRSQWSETGRLEVAGYEMGAQLQKDLDGQKMANILEKPAFPVHWFEIQSGSNAKLPLPAQKLHDQWLEFGVKVDLQALPGEAFWSTQEICELPELIQRTSAAIRAIDG